MFDGKLHMQKFSESLLSYKHTAKMCILCLKTLTDGDLRKVNVGSKIHLQLRYFIENKKGESQSLCD